MFVGHFLRRAIGLCAVACFAISFAGCEAPKPAANPQASEHSHDEPPTANFGESVGSLRKLHDQIKTAFEAGKPDDAHDALHQIGHVLEVLEKQAASVPADKQESVKAAVKALFDGYTKIDNAMHGGDESKYADMGEDLSRTLQLWKLPSRSCQHAPPNLCLPVDGRCNNDRCCYDRLQASPVLSPEMEAARKQYLLDQAPGEPVLIAEAPQARTQKPDGDCRETGCSWSDDL